MQDFIKWRMLSKIIYYAHFFCIQYIQEVKRIENSFERLKYKILMES